MYASEPVVTGLPSWAIPSLRLCDFSLSVAIAGPRASGKSSVFRRISAELQNACDPTDSPALSASYLSLDYAGRRALAKLCDYPAGQAAAVGSAHALVLVAALTDAHALAHIQQQCSSSSSSSGVVPCLVVLTRREAPAAQRRADVAAIRGFCALRQAECVLLDLHDPHGALAEPFRRLVAAALPLDAYPVVRRGLLTKQGGWVRSWKVRHFVLEAPGVLSYYPEGSEEARGSIDISKTLKILSAADCPVVWPPKTDPEACFGISVPGRTYYLVAPTPAAAKDWQADLAKFANRSPPPAAELSAVLKDNSRHASRESLTHAPAAPSSDGVVPHEGGAPFHSDSEGGISSGRASPANESIALQSAFVDFRDLQ